MRTVNLHIYPYSDVHSDNGSGPRLSQPRLDLLFDELPTMFEIGPAGGAESFRAVVDFRPGRLGGSSSRKTFADLGADLRDLIDSEPADPWAARVLLAQSSDRGLKTYGAMFDVGHGANVARRGCAVFVKAIEDSANAQLHDRFFVRTVGHEAGHVLNLCHQPRQASSLMSEGKPDADDLAMPSLTAAEAEHLTAHPEDAVRPGGPIAYRACPVAESHTNCRDETGTPESEDLDREVRLELEIHPGTVYPATRVPTLVIGEPLCLTARLHNNSGRTLELDRPPDGAHGGLELYKVEADRAIRMVSPVAACSDLGAARVQVEPGGRFDVDQVVFHRSGALVFPQAGVYRVFAVLATKDRPVASPIEAVHVAPPLKARHERLCTLAALHRCSLDLEMGGGSYLANRDHVARELLRAAPDYPLCDHIRLAAGRWAWWSEAAPYPAWRASLERVAGNERQADFLRAESRALLRSRP